MRIPGQWIGSRRFGNFPTLAVAGLSLVIGLILSAQQTTAGESPGEIRIRVSADRLCFIAEVGVQCDQLGARLKTMHMAPDSRLILEVGPDSKYDNFYSTLQPLSGQGFSNVVWTVPELPVVTGHTTATAKSVEGIRKLLSVLVCPKIDSIDAGNVPEGFNPKTAPKIPASLGSPSQEPVQYESWTVAGCGRNMKVLIQLWYSVSGNELYSASPPPDWLGGA